MPHDSLLRELVAEAAGSPASDIAATVVADTLVAELGISEAAAISLGEKAAAALRARGFAFPPR